MIIVTRKMGKQPRKQLKRIRAAVQAGQWKKARWLVVELLRSPEAKRLATRLAYRAMPRHSRADKSELDQISKHLDAWEGSSEVGYVGRQPKEHKPNEHRLTINFGIENRAFNISCFWCCAR